MKRAILAVLAVVAVVWFAGAPASAAPEDMALIVNKSNPVTSVTLAQLRKILLAQQANWQAGGRIVVWMIAPGQPGRAHTLKVVCGMSEYDYTLHFRKASSTAGEDSGDPPRTAGSPAQLRDFVGAAAYGLGLIPSSQVDDTVKVVAVEGVRPGEPGYKLTAN